MIKTYLIGRIQASLDQALAFVLSDERLQLGGREGVQVPRFRRDEEQQLRSRQSREFQSLPSTTLVSPLPFRNPTEPITHPLPFALPFS